MGFMVSCTGVSDDKSSDTPVSPEVPEIPEQVVDKQFSNPLFDGADPWIVKKDGMYYTVTSTGKGLKVSESRFLTKKEKEVQVFQCPSSGWNSANVWAPELHFVYGKWCIYYAAAKQDGSPFIHQRTGVLVADNPFGPYVDKGVIYTGDNFDNQTEDNNIWAIDMTIFVHNDKNYAVWSGWEKQADTDQTNQLTYIAEMSSPWEIGKRHLISSPTQDWEGGDNIELQEGQAALYSDNRSFILYSTRGSWTPDYCIGYLELTGENPLDANSWTKSDGPVFKQYDKTYGVGHASYTSSPDDKENWIYYHAKKGTEHGWDRYVFLQKFSFDENGYPFFGNPVQPNEKIDRPSGEVEIEKEQN